MNYTVSCSGDVTCPPNFTATDNTTRSYTITNLTTMTTYTFSVVATNSIGSGELEAGQGRSRWSGRSGHGRTGFGPYQTIYIGLQIVINLSDYIAAYASNLLVHCLKFYFTLSYDKSQFFRLWNPFI